MTHYNITVYKARDFFGEIDVLTVQFSQEATLKLTINSWEDFCCLSVSHHGDSVQCIPFECGDTFALEIQVNKECVVFATGGHHLYSYYSRSGISEEVKILQHSGDCYSVIESADFKTEELPLRPHNYKIKPLPGIWQFQGPTEFPIEFDMLESMFWDNSQIQTYQQNQLHSIVSYATKHVAFYSAYAGASYSDLPLLCKAEINDNRQLFISNEYTKYYPHLSLSSGSTGYPFKYYSSLYDIVWMGSKFFHLYIIEECGVDLFGSDKLIHLTLSGQDRNLRIDNKRAHYGIANYHPTDNEINWYAIPLLPYKNNLKYLFSRIIDMLDQDSSIKALVGLPSLFDSFIRYCLEHNYNHFRRVKYITAGELVYPEHRQLLAEHNLFHRDYFHSPDGSAIYYECSHKRYHLCHTKAFIETTPFENENYLVTSALLNTAMPFIKYVNGDAVAEYRMLGQRCRCGRAGYVVDGILGRQGDMLLASNGQFIPPTIVFSICSSYALGQWKIVQRKPDIIDLYVQYQPPGPLNRVLNNLRGYFQNATITVKDIQESPHSFRKSRFIIREDF